MAATIVCGLDERTAPPVVRFAAELSADLDSRLVIARVDRRSGGDGTIELPDGVTAETRTHVGRPAEGLAAIAADEGADLLVVGSRGRGAMAAALLGSVSRSLARTAPCPVAILTPAAAERYVRGSNGTRGPIVCGVDGSERALEGALLAQELAVRLGERVTLTYARDFPTTGAPGRRTEREVVGAAVAALDAEVAVAIEEGPAAHALLSVAARTRARMLVAAPRGPVGGMRAAVLGSVTSFLASNAPCPLVLPAPAPSG